MPQRALLWAVQCALSCTRRLKLTRTWRSSSGLIFFIYFPPPPTTVGGPGSGKGTQCLKIAERYGFQYVSVGELLRKKMIHNATSNRKWSLIAKIITNGELAPQVVKEWHRKDGVATQ